MRARLRSSTYSSCGLRTALAICLTIPAIFFPELANAAPTLARTEISVPFAISPIKPDPSRNLVYVVDATYDRLLVINTDTGAQVAEADIEDGQTEGEIAISVDDTKLYLSESTENKILVFSLPTLTPLPSLSLDFPPQSIASAVNGRLFAANFSGQWNTKIVELSPTDGSIIQSFGSAQDYYDGPMLRINADGTHLYATEVGLEGDANLYMYDLTGETIGTPTAYGYQPENLAEIAPDEAKGRIYHMSGGIYGVNVILTANDNVATVWPLTGAYGWAVSFNATANVVFGAAADPYTGDIREYNRDDGAPIADWVVTTDTNPILRRGIAATANGSCFYARSTNYYSSGLPAFLGLISPSGSSISLVPTIVQTVTFTSLGSDGNAGDSVTLQATDSAGLPIVYTVVSGPATIVGNKLTYTGAGTVVIAASQAGNGVFKPTSVTQTITVTKGTQTISSFSVIPNQSYGTSSFAVTPPASSSGLPVTVTVKSGPATISNGLITLTGVGAVTLAADQAGNASFFSAPEVTTSFLVNKGPQTINAFSPIPTQTGGIAPFAITFPTASSALPVTVTVQSGPATLNGDIITLTGPGTVVLAANQSGNSNYLAAPTVTTEFTVNGVSQRIEPFQPIAPRTYSPTPFSIATPTASSGLPVVVSVISGPATISNGIVTLTGVGTVVLAANQSGNSIYLAAPTVTTEFVVNGAAQKIGPFQTIAPRTYSPAPFSITAPTASSGLPVVVSVISGPALISNEIVTLTGAGTVVLAANQPGNSSFMAAPQVTTQFTVKFATQKISPFASIPTQILGAGPFSITPPTASSGLPVTVSILGGYATISGDTITPTGLGLVTVVANQAGNAGYAAAAEVKTTFYVKSAQTIPAFTVEDHTFGAAPFAVPPMTSSAGLPVTVTVLSGPAQIYRGRVSLIGAGTVVLAANQAGNLTVAPAPTVTTSFTVSPDSQTIAGFTGLKTVTYGIAPFAVRPPAATSKLPVVLTVQSGPATILNNKVTVTGPGVVVLAADQAGNANYNAATEVTGSFTVNKANQTIARFARIAAKTAASSPFAVTMPTTTSHLTVSLSVKSGPATINNNIVSILGSGTIVLAADQAGDVDYNPAPEVLTTIVVK